MSNKKYKITIVILIVIILLLLLFICFKGFFTKDVREDVVNVFEIKCDYNCKCNDKQDTDSNISSDDNVSGNKTSTSVSKYENSKINNFDNNDNTGNNNSKTEYSDAIEIYDDNISWRSDNDLKIFENSTYKNSNIIAPGITGKYKFVVSNKTRFDIKYTMLFEETNDYGINMKYRLLNGNNYIVSDWSDYTSLNQNDVNLFSGNGNTYYLEWKWFDSSNDTSIGSSGVANYKLKINIKAEQIND